MDDKKSRRGSPALTDDKENTPPPDRDQAAYSAVRAQEKADQAEFSGTTGAQDEPEPEEPLVARDNMKGAPPRSGSS